MPASSGSMHEYMCNNILVSLLEIESKIYHFDKHTSQKIWQNLYMNFK